MEDAKKGTYTKGYVNALKEFGEVCSSNSCESCAIASLRGSELSCQEFMKKFPEKFASMLEFMQDKEQTFLNEFRTRFPDCELEDKDIPDTLCRKMVFEGYVDCEGGDCVACWEEPYTGVDAPVEE